MQDKQKIRTRTCKWRLSKICSNFEDIENYDKALADDFRGWCVHHKMELVKTGAVVDSSAQDLIDWGIYYNRPADELIFMTKSEHLKLHGPTYKRAIKTGNTNVRDKHWYNNGVVSTMAFECPEGFVEGQLRTKRGK